MYSHQERSKFHSDYNIIYYTFCTQNLSHVINLFKANSKERNRGTERINKYCTEKIQF